MKNYSLDEVKDWKMVFGYENFDGNIRILYIAGSNNAYLYKAESDEMEYIDNSKHLALFYRVIDDARYVAYITKNMLKYLAENVYFMNHYPLKSKEMMRRIMDFAVITGEIGKI